MTGEGARVLFCFSAMRRAAIASLRKIGISETQHSRWSPRARRATASILALSPSRPDHESHFSLRALRRRFVRAGGYVDSRDAHAGLGTAHRSEHPQARLLRHAQLA